MRSADRTLLASLSFGDPDKANPIHDWACQYMAVPDIKLRVAGMVYPNQEIRVSGPMFERMITKGEGQYATTIGFTDVCFYLKFPDNSCSDDDKWKYAFPGCLCVEVKIDPVPAGDVIRQINLYKEYNYSLFKGYLSDLDIENFVRRRRRVPPVKWVLATHFIYDEYDMAALKGSGIHPVHLGQAFDEWCEKRRAFHE